jgi:hypothetical protein
LYKVTLTKLWAASAESTAAAALQVLIQTTAVFRSHPQSVGIILPQISKENLASS